MFIIIFHRIYGFRFYRKFGNPVNKTTNKACNTLQGTLSVLLGHADEQIDERDRMKCGRQADQPPCGLPQILSLEAHLLHHVSPWNHLCRHPYHAQRKTFGISTRKCVRVMDSAVMPSM